MNIMSYSGSIFMTHIANFSMFYQDFVLDKNKGILTVKGK